MLRVPRPLAARTVGPYCVCCGVGVQACTCPYLRDACIPECLLPECVHGACAARTCPGAGLEYKETKEAISRLLQEFAASRDAGEAARCLRSLHVPFFYHEVRALCTCPSQNTRRAPPCMCPSDNTRCAPFTAARSSTESLYPALLHGPAPKASALHCRTVQHRKLLPFTAARSSTKSLCPALPHGPAPKASALHCRTVQHRKPLPFTAARSSTKSLYPSLLHGPAPKASALHCCTVQHQKPLPFTARTPRSHGVERSSSVICHRLHSWPQAQHVHPERVVVCRQQSWPT